jgi:hypothetical protein
MKQARGVGQLNLSHAKVHEASGTKVEIQIYSKLSHAKVITNADL